MQNRLINFAKQYGLVLAPNSAEKLLSYGQRVLDKKPQLNLTGAATLEEIVNRHLCDGLFGAAQLAALAGKKKTFTVTDAGAGAGFIGITIAVALPQAQVTLVESLAKRCAFLNWVVLQEKLPNVTVKNIRLGQQELPLTDYLTERAMGQLPDILEICLTAVKPGGVFLAYQGQQPQLDVLDPQKYGASWEQVLDYQLPQDKAPKHLILCRKAL